MLKRWLVAIILLGVPIGCGIAAAALVRAGVWAEKALVARYLLSEVYVALGAAVSGVGVLWIAFRSWANRRRSTDLARLQTQFTQQRNADRQQFIRRLDHELKNPLTAVQVATATLRQTQLNEPYRGSISDIEAATTRMSRVVEGLRKLSNIETQDIKFKPVNLRDLLEDVVASVEDRADASQRRIALNLPEYELPVIRGDYSLIELAVYNLIDNAVKYSRAGDRITISATKESNRARIEVADTGLGMSQEVMARAFDEMYRYEGTASAAPGSGLGLSLVRAAVQRHGGECELNSIKDVGTRVTLRLPINPRDGGERVSG